MSSNQQYKDYNKRLKTKIRNLESDSKYKIAVINKLSYSCNDAITKLEITGEEIIKLKRQLKQSKRWYQIILK